MEFRDYYATLGVTKTASGKEIKQAYRKLARKFHPDVNPGDAKAEQRFKEINEAYEVLGDAEKRKKYDELGANWRLYEQMPPGYGAPGGTGGFDGWTVNTGPGATVFSTDDLNDMLGGENSPFSDFFQAFFGGQAARPKGGRSAPRRRPGSDVEQDVTLSLDEAFHGTTRRLGIKTRGHSRTVDVRIPPGVKDGARVRLPGEGEAGLGGARSGDLFLRVHLQAHDTFERRGQDLHVRITIPLLTAVLGGEAEVPTLGGRALRLKIPETTQNGQAFRLRGHGMPAAGRPGEVGDLYVTVEVQLPRQLSADERTHYEALKHLES